MVNFTVDDDEYGARNEGSNLNITSGVKETLININCPVGSIIDHVRELTSFGGRKKLINKLLFSII